MARSQRHLDAGCAGAHDTPLDLSATAVEDADFSAGLQPKDLDQVP